MIQPDKPAHTNDDDDFDLELPLEGEGDDEEDGGLREDESFLPDDDADLGLDGDEKTVGLDADAGLEDAQDSDDDEVDEEEEGSWLGDDEIDPSLNGDESDVDGEEEGSAGDTEPAKDNGDDWDEDVSFDEGGAPLGDSGEEGFGDDSGATEIDLDHLPPLDGGIAADGAEAEDNETDALGTDLFDEIPAVAEGDDSSIEIAPGLRCTRLPTTRVSIETLLRVDRPLAFLIATGETALGWDGSLLVARGATALRPERRAAGEGKPFAIAALETGNELLIAFASARGLLCSRDGGHTFAPAHAPIEGEWMAASLAWSRSAHGPRLFAAAPAGALWSSDDFGVTWRQRADERVLDLHADGKNALVAVCRDDSGGARALRSRDGGESFGAIVLPVREVERVQDVQTLGEVLLCCRRAPAPQLVWRGHSDAWQDLAPFACAPATLLEQDREACAYFFVQTQERALLLRRVLGARVRAPEIVCELLHDAGTPLQLLASHQAGEPTLQIGTERGWYRVRIRAAGEDA